MGCPFKLCIFNKCVSHLNESFPEYLTLTHHLNGGEPTSNLFLCLTLVIRLMKSDDLRLFRSPDQ